VVLERRGADSLSRREVNCIGDGRRHGRAAEDRGGQGPSDEDRTTIGVSGALRIGAATRLVARYEYQHNAADLAAYDYDRNRFSIGIEYAR
jgi:hypothetical protein